MRLFHVPPRTAIFGMVLMLSACQTVSDSVGGYVGDPSDGWFGFLGDTISFKANPNRPLPESDNIRRAMGEDVQVEPVVTEAGNIWPSQPRAEPTVQALQRAPDPTPPRPAVAAPVPQATPARPAVAPTAPAPTPASAPASAAPIAPANTAGTLSTPKGNAILTTGPNGIITYTLPSGATGRAIDNGNGTMTLIGADGQVMSVPAPR